MCLKYEVGLIVFTTPCYQHLYLSRMWTSLVAHRLKAGLSMHSGHGSEISLQSRNTLLNTLHLMPTNRITSNWAVRSGGFEICSSVYFACLPVCWCIPPAVRIERSFGRAIPPYLLSNVGIVGWQQIRLPWFLPGVCHFHRILSI